MSMKEEHMERKHSWGTKCTVQCK